MIHVVVERLLLGGQRTKKEIIVDLNHRVGLAFTCGKIIASEEPAAPDNYDFATADWCAREDASPMNRRGPKIEARKIP